MRNSILWLVLGLVACGESGGEDGGSLEDGGLLPDGGLPDGGTQDAGAPVDAGNLFEVCEVAAQAGGQPPECTVVAGGACMTGADCPSGICLSLASGKVCTQPCVVDVDCSNARVCELRNTGIGSEGFCVPAKRGAP